MTVESSNQKSGPFVAAGTAGTFPRNFLVLDASHVRVIRVRDGEESDIESGAIVHTGIGQVSGTVNIASGLQVGDLVYILRAVPNVQRSDYSSQAAIPPTQVESDLDLLQMQVQDLKEAQTRALTLAVSAEVTGEEAMAAALAAPDYAAAAKEYAELAEAYAAEANVEGVLSGSVKLTSNASFFGGDTVRAPGRVLIGDSSTMTNQPAGYPGSVRSWLADVPNQNGGAGWFEVSAKLAVTTEFGIGIMGASRTAPGANSNVSNFGGACLVWNRGIGNGLNARAWGHYVEAYNAPTTGRLVDHTHLFEYAVLNSDASTIIRPFNPYSAYDKGDTYGGTINSGVIAGNDGHPVRWGLRFTTVGKYNAEDVQNSNGFMTGIVFRRNALLPWPDGRKRAMVMDRLDNLSWWYGTNEANAFEAFQIESAITQSSAAQKQVANNGGMTFQNAAGNPFLYVNMAAGATAPNYLSLVAVDGAAPRIASNGTATNVDLSLSPKGTGCVVIPLDNIRSYGSDAGAAAGGVPIGGLYRSGNDLKIRLV